MWVNMHVGESYAGQKNSSNYSGWTVTVSERYGGWTITVGEHVCGWTCMWVNMHLSESYLDENYADQKNGGWKCMWFKALWLNIQVGECTWYVLNEGGPGGNYIPIQVTVL